MSDSLTATVAMQFVVQLIDPSTEKPTEIFGTAAEIQLLGIQRQLAELCKHPKQEWPFEVQDPAWFDDYELEHLPFAGIENAKVRIVLHPYRQSLENPRHSLDVAVRAKLSRASERLQEFLAGAMFNGWMLQVALKSVLLTSQTSDALLLNEDFLQYARQQRFPPAEETRRGSLTESPAARNARLRLRTNALVSQPADTLHHPTNVVKLDQFRKK